MKSIRLKASIQECLMFTEHAKVKVSIKIPADQHEINNKLHLLIRSIYLFPKHNYILAFIILNFLQF